MRRYTLEIKGKEYVIDVQELSADRFRVILGEQALEVQVASHEDLAPSPITPGVISMGPGDEAVIARPQASYRPPDPSTLGSPPRVRTPPQPAKPFLPSDGLRVEVIAPMPGVIQSVEVKVGDEVQHGQTLVVLEAMKMKNAIRSSRQGVVGEVLVQPGQSVGYGDILLKFEDVSK